MGTIPNKNTPISFSTAYQKNIKPSDSINNISRTENISLNSLPGSSFDDADEPSDKASGPA